MVVRAWPCVKKVEEENPWVTYVKMRIHKENNCINSIWTGKPGSGKSWGMLSFFCLIDPDFKLENNWFFKASKLMRAIKDGNYKSGKIWGFDEAGIDLNNLRYYDEVNKGLNAFLQTARHRNYVFAFSVPYISLVSKGVRTLMNCHFKAEGWNNQNKTVIYPRYLEYNGEMDKFYKKRLIVKHPTNSDFCERILLPKPPKKLIREYEKLKTEFTANLFDNIATKIENYEHKEKAQLKQGLFTQKQEEILSMLKKKMTVEDIRNELNIRETTIYEHIKSLNKKGIEIQAVKEGKLIKYYKINDYRSKSPREMGFSNG